MKEVLLPEGLASLTEAFAEAQTEIGVAAPVDTEPTPQVAEVEVVTPSEQAPVDVSEQPEDVEPSIDTVDEDLQSLLDEGEPETVAPEADTPTDVVGEFVGSDEFWATEVEIDGVDGLSQVTLRDLTDSYMRQSDYTKKTQELATQREGAKDATEFYDAFVADPAGFAAALGIKAGLLDVNEVPATSVEVPQWISPELQEAEIERRVTERIGNDPSIQSAKLAESRAAVTETFAAIEAANGVTLNDTRRQSILDEAIASGTANLNLVFEAQVGRARARQAQATRAKQASPSRATSTSSPDTPATDPQARTVEDAFNQARQQLAVVQ